MLGTAASTSMTRPSPLPITSTVGNARERPRAAPHHPRTSDSCAPSPPAVCVVRPSSAVSASHGGGPSRHADLAELLRIPARMRIRASPRTRDGSALARLPVERRDAPVADGSNEQRRRHRLLCRFRRRSPGSPSGMPTGVVQLRSMQALRSSTHRDTLTYQVAGAAMLLSGLLYRARVPWRALRARWLGT